jgi:hypothetical protein
MDQPRSHHVPHTMWVQGLRVSGLRWHGPAASLEFLTLAKAMLSSLRLASGGVLSALFAAKANFRVILLLAVLLGFVPSFAMAQVTGTVTNSSGFPLESVAVESWLAGRRVAATFTNKAGRYILSDSLSARADELRTGALGFKTQTIPMRPGVSVYDIRLEAEPLMLEGLEVVMEGDICNRKDDRSARGLWEHARSHYQQGLDTLGIATYLAEADTVVRREDIGPLALPELALSQRGSGSIQRFSWERRIKRDGYAIKVVRTDGAATFDSWVYAPLEADVSSHFVGELFGDLHKFVDPIQDADGWTVTFCPKDDDDVSIRGTVVLAPDTTLSSVEWSFLTPDPVERAGGRATFTPLMGGVELAYPLPTEALIWKQVPDGRYFQLYQRYDGWRVVPGDSVPQLPLRRTSGGN